MDTQQYPLDHADPDFFYRYNLLQPLTQMAADGNRRAQFLLAEHYEKQEDGLNRSYYWYRRYAESGDGTDWGRVALFLQYHGYSPEHEEERVRCLLRAAENGNDYAALQLFRVYRTGKRENIPLAVYWLGRAAETDLSEALTELAECYLAGFGVEESSAKAQELLRRALRTGVYGDPSGLAQFLYDRNVAEHGCLPPPDRTSLFPPYPTPDR